jgi:predicted DNA-binding transcriptional regulator AlpA
MTSYDFMLSFELPEPTTDPSTLLDALYEAGCDDATPGVGRPGMLGLAFTRQAASAAAAVKSAIKHVRRAAPRAKLVGVAPDLVSISDIAELTGVTRQNIHKYAAGEIQTLAVPFPAPVYAGTSSLWRLSDVAPWLIKHTKLRIERSLVELAFVTSRVNLDVQRARVRRTRQEITGQSGPDPRTSR